MPLITSAHSLIRENLERIHNGRTPRTVVIARLTNEQLETLNAYRAYGGYPPMAADIVFKGKHIYNSRFVRDGYTVGDIIDQISSALACTSIVLDTRPMTTMRNPAGRRDRYGNSGIQDEAVFECTANHPRPELYSVIPRGDHVKPQKEKPR